MFFLFFHGGPGFNSNPERGLFFPHFMEKGWEVIGWDEPSLLRPQGHPFSAANTYENALAAAESFILENSQGKNAVWLLCHSFGAQTGLHLARKYSGRIHSMVFISPAFDMEITDLSILKIARDDYLNNDPMMAKEVEQVIADYSGEFDDNMMRGFQLVIKNLRYFNYYWTDHQKMKAYFQGFADPAYAFDPQSYIGIRQSFLEDSGEAIDLPAVCIFGKNDPVIPRTKTRDHFLRLFPHGKVHTINNTGHYPHIECTDRCLEIISKASALD